MSVDEKLDKMAKFDLDHSSCVMCDDPLPLDLEGGYNSKFNYKLSQCESRALCKVLRLPYFPFDFQFLQAMFCQECKASVKDSSVIFDKIEKWNLQLNSIRCMMQNKLAKFAAILYSHTTAPRNLEEINIRNKPVNDSSLRWEIRKQVFEGLQAIARKEVNYDYDGDRNVSQGMSVRMQGGQLTDCLPKTEKEIHNVLSPQSMSSEISQHDNHPSPDDPESDLSSQQGGSVSKSQACEESAHLSPQVIENQEPRSNSETVNLESVESNDIDHADVGYAIGSQRSQDSSENENMQMYVTESHDRRNVGCQNYSSSKRDGNTVKYSQSTPPTEEREDDKQIECINVDKDCQTDKLELEYNDYEHATTNTPEHHRSSEMHLENHDEILETHLPNSSQTNSSHSQGIADTEDSARQVISPTNNTETTLPNDNQIITSNSKQSDLPNDSQLGSSMEPAHVISPEDNEIMSPSEKFPSPQHEAPVISSKDSQIGLLDANQLTSPHDGQLFSSQDSPVVSPKGTSHDGCQAKESQGQGIAQNKNQMISPHHTNSPHNDQVISPKHSHRIIVPSEDQMVSPYENLTASPNNNQDMSPKDSQGIIVPSNDQIESPNSNHNHTASPSNGQAISSKGCQRIAASDAQVVSPYDSPIASQNIPKNEIALPADRPTIVLSDSQLATLNGCQGQIVSPHPNPISDVNLIVSPNYSHITSPSSRQMVSPNANQMTSPNDSQTTSPHDDYVRSYMHQQDSSFRKEQISIQCSLDFSALTEADNENCPAGTSLLIPGIDFSPMNETQNETTCNMQSSGMLSEMNYGGQEVHVSIANNSLIFSTPTVMSHLSSHETSSSLSKLPPINVSSVNDIHAIPAELDFSSFTTDMSASTVEVSPTGFPEIHFSQISVGGNMQSHDMGTCSFSAPMIPLVTNIGNAHLSSDEVSSSSSDHQSLEKSDCAKGMPELLPVSPAESASVSPESDMEPPNLQQEKRFELPKLLPRPGFHETLGVHFPSMSSLTTACLPNRANVGLPSLVKHSMTELDNFSGDQQISHLSTYSVSTISQNNAYTEQQSSTLKNQDGEKFPVTLLPGSQLISPKPFLTTFGIDSSKSNVSSYCTPPRLQKSSVPPQRKLHRRKSVSIPLQHIAFSLLPHEERTASNTDKISENELDCSKLQFYKLRKDEQVASTNVPKSSSPERRQPRRRCSNNIRGTSIELPQVSFCVTIPTSSDPLPSLPVGLHFENSSSTVPHNDSAPVIATDKEITGEHVISSDESVTSIPMVTKESSVTKPVHNENSVALLTTAKADSESDDDILIVAEYRPSKSEIMNSKKFKKRKSKHRTLPVTTSRGFQIVRKPGAPRKMPAAAAIILNPKLKTINVLCEKTGEIVSKDVPVKSKEYHDNVEGISMSDSSKVKQRHKRSKSISPKPSSKRVKDRSSRSERSSPKKSSSKVRERHSKSGRSSSESASPSLKTKGRYSKSESSSPKSSSKTKEQLERLKGKSSQTKKRQHIQEIVRQSAFAKVQEHYIERIKSNPDSRLEHGQHIDNMSSKPFLKGEKQHVDIINSTLSQEQEHIIEKVISSPDFSPDPERYTKSIVSKPAFSKGEEQQAKNIVSKPLVAHKQEKHIDFSFDIEHHLEMGEVPKPGSKKEPRKRSGEKTSRSRSKRKRKTKVISEPNSDSDADFHILKSIRTSVTAPNEVLEKARMSPDISELGTSTPTCKAATRNTPFRQAKTKKAPEPEIPQPSASKKRVRSRPHKKARPNIPVPVEDVKDDSEKSDPGLAADPTNLLQTISEAIVQGIYKRPSHLELMKRVNRKTLSISVEKMNIGALSCPEGALIGGNQVKVNLASLPLLSHREVKNISGAPGGITSSENAAKANFPSSSSTASSMGESSFSGSRTVSLSETSSLRYLAATTGGETKPRSHKRKKPKLPAIDRQIMPISERQQIKKLLQPVLSSVIEISANSSGSRDSPSLAATPAIEASSSDLAAGPSSSVKPINIPTPEQPESQSPLTPQLLKINTKRFVDGIEEHEVMTPENTAEKSLLEDDGAGELVAEQIASRRSSSLGLGDSRSPIAADALTRKEVGQTLSGRKVFKIGYD